MKKLLQEIAGIIPSEFDLKFGPVEEGEIVIGELSLELQQLFCCCSLSHDRLEEMIKPVGEKAKAHEALHLAGNHKREDCEVAIAEFDKAMETINPFKVEYENLIQLFWCWVRFEYPECGSSVSVRDGFILVTEEKEQETLSPVYSFEGGISIIRI